MVPLLYHLTDFDKNPECKILISNKVKNFKDSDVRQLESKSSKRKRILSSSSPIEIIESESVVELLVPIKDKDFLCRCVPYFKNLLNDDNSNLFGHKSYAEIDGQKCLIINDQEPRIFADILKFLYTGELDLTLDNCIEIYRITDFINLCAKMDAESDGKPEYLVDDVYKFIDRNLAQLSEIQFEKIRRYNLQDRFWKSMYEKLHSFQSPCPVKIENASDEDSISINVIYGFVTWDCRLLDMGAR